MDGKPLFKFERRILPRDMKEVTPAEQIEDDDEETAAGEGEAAAQETVERS